MSGTRDTNEPWRHVSAGLVLALASACAAAPAVPATAAVRVAPATAATAMTSGTPLAPSAAGTRGGWEGAAAPVRHATEAMPARGSQERYEFQPGGKRPEWRPGQPYLQGYVGVGFVDELTRRGGDDPNVEADFDTYPTIGGGGQWKLGGERVDWGIEGLLAFGGRVDAAAFTSGGGGAAIALRIDMLLFDIYGGPFASAFLGERVRVYAGAGPLVQWASYEQSDGLSGSGTGFGVGYYGRGGIEFLITPGTLAGIGARWADSRVDLGSGLGDVDVRGSQVFVTVTRGF